MKSKRQIRLDKFKHSQKKLNRKNELKKLFEKTELSNAQKLSLFYFKVQSIFINSLIKFKKLWHGK
jgi:hypothetical protein